MWLTGLVAPRHVACGMWDPPRPGLEPVSPALAGRLSTTAPPGKALIVVNLNRALPVSAAVSGAGAGMESAGAGALPRYEGRQGVRGLWEGRPGRGAAATVHDGS